MAEHPSRKEWLPAGRERRAAHTQRCELILEQRRRDLLGCLAPPEHWAFLKVNQPVANLQEKERSVMRCAYSFRQRRPVSELQGALIFGERAAVS